MSTPMRDPFLTTSATDESPVINSDYIALKRAWMNEARCPELLPYESRLVENMMKSLRSQWSLISARQAQWAGRDSYIRDLLTLEADRVGYVLKSYLRARLFKIQKFARHYLMTSTHLLSPAETNFARNLLQISDEAFTSMFLRHLPQGDEYFQSLTASDDPGGDMVRRPKLDRAVFVRVNDAVGSVGPDSATLEKDHNYIVRYDLVRDLLADGRINLI
jgi:GINS complex subunit 4